MPPRAVARTTVEVLRIPLALAFAAVRSGELPPESDRLLPPRAVARTAGWILLLPLAAALAAVGGTELYFRLALPYMTAEPPYALVPGVGRVFRPGADVWARERRDRRFVARANGLGFLDREPGDLRRADESCRIAVLGGAFVEAREIPLANKFHVHLETLAAAAAPGLDIAASAYGIAEAGPIAQLAYYDAYARRTNPEVLVLVYERPDLYRNAPLNWALRRGHDPDRYPHVTALQARDGTMTLRPPGTDSPRLRDARMARIPAPPDPWPTRAIETLAPYSRLATYIAARTELPRARLPDGHKRLQRARWIELLRQRPHYDWILPAPAIREEGSLVAAPPRKMDRPRYREYTFAFTAFALDRFKARAARDGAALVVLATWDAWGPHDPVLKLRALARERGIPVLHQGDYDYVGGVFPTDARFTLDPGVRSAARHRRAAEALLAWLAGNPHVCAPSPADALPPPKTPYPPARQRRGAGRGAVNRPGCAGCFAPQEKKLRAASSAPEGSAAAGSAIHASMSE